MRKVRKALELGRRDIYIAAVLFLLAFSVRYYFKAAGLFHTDSVIGARAAEDTLSTGRLQYLQGDLGYPGESVLNTLTYAVFNLFGATNAEYSTLFSGVLYGALCVPMIYFLSKKLFNSEHAAVYSALILTFLPVHLSLSTYGKGHGMELFFLLLSAYLAHTAGEVKTLKLKLLASMSLGFTMAIRQTTALFFPAFLLLYWRGNPPLEFKKRRGKAKVKLRHAYAEIALDLAVLIIPAFIVFILFFVPKMMYNPSYSLIEKIQSVSGETNRGFELFSPMLSLSLDWATLSLTWVGWILALAGLYFTWNEDKHTSIALALWFILFFMYLGNIISTSPRFVIPALAVPVMLSAAAIDKIRLKRDQTAAGVVLFILIAWMMYNIYPVIEYRRNYCGPCEFSKKIAEVTEPDAVVIAMDESQHYEYYSKRKTIGHPSGRDLANPYKIQESLDYIEGLLLNGTPVYATTQGLGYDILIQDFLAYRKEDMMLLNTQTGQLYSNLKLDIQSSQLYDLQTGVVLPLTGIWGLGLFNRFSVKPVLTVENEDWHHKSITKGVYTAVLYKISLREVVDAQAR
jgi:hypothetical protein